VPEPSPEELKAHERALDRIGKQIKGPSLWRRLEEQAKYRAGREPE
jgi:hypothetical protein